MACNCRRGMNGLGSLGTATTYTVQRGDSLTAIVLKLGLCTKGPTNSKADWQNCYDVALAVARRNNISNADLIYPGQVLYLDNLQVGNESVPDYGNGGGSTVGTTNPLTLPSTPSKPLPKWALPLAAGVLAYMIFGDEINAMLGLKPQKARA